MFEEYETIIVYNEPRASNQQFLLRKMEAMGAYLSETSDKTHILHHNITDSISKLINEFDPENSRAEYHGLPENLLRQPNLFQTQSFSELLLIPGEENLTYVINKISKERNIQIPKPNIGTAIELTRDNTILKISSNIEHRIKTTNLN